MSDESDYQDYLDYQAYLQSQGTQGAVDRANPSTWPKDASGQPVNPDSPMAGPQPTGIINPRVLAAGATRAVSGLAQAAVAPVETATGLPLVKGVTEGTLGVENAIAGDNPGWGGVTPQDVEGAKTGSGMLASLLIPIPKVGQGAKGAALVKGITRSGAAGGALGAATFDPGAESSWDKYTQAAFGVGVGALVGAISNAYPAGVNYIRRLFTEKPTAETQKALDAIAKSKPVQDNLTHLTGAQTTGNYELEVQEARAAGTVAREQANNAMERARQTLVRAFRQPKLTSTEIGGRVQSAINADRAAAQGAASRAYESTTDAAKTVAKSDPGYNFGISLPNTSKAVVDNFPTGSAWYDDLIDPALKKYGKQIDETAQLIVNGGGRLPMDDLISLHQAATRLRSGIATLERGGNVSDQAYSAMRMGKSLTQAIEKDVGLMDDAINQAKAQPGFAQAFPNGAPGEKFQEAWGLFKGAREDYRTFIGQQRALDQSVVAMAFGKDARDAAGQLRVLANSEVGEQRRLIQIMRQHDPEALTELKRWKINDASQRMVDQTKPGAVSVVDPKAFISELTSGDKISGELLFNDAERKHIEASVAYMRLIENRANLASRPAELKRVGMAAVSRATAFVMGSLYDIAVNKRLEWLFFTPEGRKALETVAKAPEGSEQFIRASTVLANASAGSPQQ